MKIKGKYVVLLDQDGPLAEFDTKYWDFCQEMGLTMNITSLQDPGRARFMENNILDKKHRQVARKFIETGHNRWFRDLPVTPGAKEGVAELLADDRIDLWVCTKPMEKNSTCRDDKAAWIAEHFPELVKKIILAPDKSLVRGHVLLDDAPRIDWLRRAEWEAVVFPSVFNAEGSQWEGIRTWTWGDPVDKLLGLD